jgi:hypothetical protein
MENSLKIYAEYWGISAISSQFLAGSAEPNNSVWTSNLHRISKSYRIDLLQVKNCQFCIYKTAINYCKTSISKFDLKSYLYIRRIHWKQSWKLLLK